MLWLIRIKIKNKWETTGYLSYMAFTAGGPAWASFLGLFYKSKFTHVMSLDFLVLTLMAPFWILNDAELRKWKNG